MPNDDFDPFALERNLPFPEDFNGTITANHFSRNEYGTYLELELFPDEGAAFNHRYNCPPGWDTPDGELVESSAGKTNFNANSQIAKFVQSALTAGAGDILRKRGGRLGPRDSRIWSGLRFHFKNNHSEGTINGKEWKTDKLYCEKYLGVDESLGVQEPAPVEEKIHLSGGGVSIDVPKSLGTKLVALAKTHDDHGKFVDAALATPGAIDIDGLTDALVNTDWYAALRG